MKKVIFLMIVFACVFSSCRKDYLCQCYTTSGGYALATRTFTVSASNDNAAEILCASGEHSGETCQVSN